MRRTYLRGHVNILKRMLVQVGGFNLGLLMRKLFGVGKPRRPQGLFLRIFWPIWVVWRVLAAIGREMGASEHPDDHFMPRRCAA